MLLPAPATATGQLTAGQPRRPAPSVWAFCQPCSGTGTVADMFGRPSTCLTCGGAGRYRVDGYTDTQVLSVDSAGTTGRDWIGCAWCQTLPSSETEAAKSHDRMPRGTGMRGGQRCEPCEGTGRRWITREPDMAAVSASLDQDPDYVLLVDPRVRRMLRQLDRRRRQGSYVELEHALGLLRDLDRRAFRAFVDEHVLQADGIRDPLELAYAEATVESLMPGRIRVPAEVAEAWVRLQDGATLEERCRTLSRRGVGMRAIAAAQGVTVWQVRKALGHTTPRTAA